MLLAHRQPSDQQRLLHLHAMGQGASVGAGNKLRNILVVKAYNARPKDTSLEEQFAPYVQVDDDNNTFLSSEDVRAALRLEPEQMHRLLQRFGATLGGRIGYGEFMGFLDGQRACGAKQRRGTRSYAWGRQCTALRLIKNDGGWLDAIARRNYSKRYTAGSLSY